jgi:tetratricopeptide (TPR) repeat protein
LSMSKMCLKISFFIIVATLSFSLFSQDVVQDPFKLKLENIKNEIDEIRNLSDEAQARYLSPLLMKTEYTEPVSNKMEKAKFYFDNKDYISSGSIYYSIVMSATERDEVWEEALYYLAESLYRNRNYISSTRYYEMLITGKPESKHRYDCLKKLIDSAYRLGNYGDAKNYYSIFIDAGYDITTDPDLAYYLAKSMFFDGFAKESFNVFSTMKAEDRYYLQSLYFLGVIELRQGNLDTALGYFENILLTEKSEDYHGHRKIRDLAMLAAARIAFELNDFVKSVRYYLSLDKRSDHFAQAYYELCWTYIKREEYVKAIDALRLIKFIDPNSIVVPHAEILEGSLLIKLERYGEAMVLFSSIVRKYGEIKEELYSINSKNIGSSNTDGKSAFNPFSSVARSLLQDNKKYTNAVSLYDDIEEIEKEIERTEKLERKLGSVIVNENAASVFPPLKEGSNLALSLQNRTVTVRNDLMGMKKDIIWENLSESKRIRFEKLEEEKSKLSNTVEGMPLSAQDLEKKAAEYARKIISMEEELNRITIQVKTFHKQLDGINSYHSKNSVQGTGSKLSERIEKEKEEINKIVEELNAHKRSVEDEKNRLVLGGDMVSRVIIGRNSLNKIISEQQEILSSAKGVSQYASEIESFLEETIEIEKSLDKFYADMNSVVSNIISKIRSSYESELNNLNEYKSELFTIKREVEEMASLAMYSNINRVRSVFSDIVLKADLGIIDVAWEKKDKATDEILQQRIKRAEEIKALYSDVERVE